MRYELYLFRVDEYYQAQSIALSIQSKKYEPHTFDALQAFDVLAITSEIASKFQTVYRDGIFSAPDSQHESWDFRTDNGLLWQILPQKVDAKALDEYPSGYGHLIRIQINPMRAFALVHVRIVQRAECFLRKRILLGGRCLQRQDRRGGIPIE